MLNDILKPHLARYACKEFDPNKKIPIEEFATLLEVARLSPSSFGLEPWKILVLQNKDLISKLFPYTWGAQKQLPTASHTIILLAKKGKAIRFDNDYIRYIKAEIQAYPPKKVQASIHKLEEFQRDDFDLLGPDEDRKLFEWSARQTYIMQGNMMTAAAQMGIDSCPIEGYNVEEVTRILKEAFSVNTEEYGITVMICFGYRIKEPRPKTRQKMEDIVEWFK